ncbi:MAG: hypothetical protein CVT68_06110, partial [Actinobacteria bacterium HGW-Actinobacteria-8]
LSASGAERIRAACRELEIELVGEVAFDPDLPAALEAVAQGARTPESLQELDSVREVEAIWERLGDWVKGWAAA